MRPLLVLRKKLRNRDHSKKDDPSRWRILINIFSRIDTRDRHDRIEYETTHWNVQMPELVAAYLRYRSQGLGDGFPPQQHSNEAPVPTPKLTLSNVQLIDMFSESVRHCPILNIDSL